MKLLFFSYLLVCLLTLVAGAVAPQKAVVVTYPKETPDWVMDQAKEAIRKAGGMVTHEYELLKGFAAQASSKALQTVNSLSAQYLPIIEEDLIVSIDGDLISGGHTS